MRKRRANTQPEDRVAILKRHLVEKVLVSDLCDEFDIQPTQFYQWQKVFFEKGAAAFERKNARKCDSKDRRIAALEEKLAKKNWAFHALASPVQDMSVNHGRSHIVMAQEFLDRSNVIAAFQNLCGE